MRNVERARVVLEGKQEVNTTQGTPEGSVRRRLSESVSDLPANRGAEFARKHGVVNAPARAAAAEAMTP